MAPRLEIRFDLIASSAQLTLEAAKGRAALNQLGGAGQRSFGMMDMSQRSLVQTSAKLSRGIGQLGYALGGLDPSLFRITSGVLRLESAFMGLGSAGGIAGLAIVGGIAAVSGIVAIIKSDREAAEQLAKVKKDMTDTINRPMPGTEKHTLADDYDKQIKDLYAERDKLAKEIHGGWTEDVATALFGKSGRKEQLTEQALVPFWKKIDDLKAAKAAWVENQNVFEPTSWSVATAFEATLPGIIHGLEQVAAIEKAIAAIDFKMELDAAETAYEQLNAQVEKFADQMKQARNIEEEINPAKKFAREALDIQALVDSGALNEEDAQKKITAMMGQMQRSGDRGGSPFVQTSVFAGPNMGSNNIPQLMREQITEAGKTNGLLQRVIDKLGMAS